MRYLLTIRRLALAFSWLMLAAPPGSSAWAHGGASAVIDTCRIPVGNYWVHFTGYQPNLYGTEEFCEGLPGLGQSNIVFDYVEKELRNLSVEFELTKEPEGKQVFYSPPKTYSTGSINNVVDFTEPGNYLAHVMLVFEGQKVDAHLPFTVGMGRSEVTQSYILMGVVALIGVLAILYLSSATVKQKVDAVFKKV